MSLGGTWDHVDPVVQMRAIDVAMTHYFGTSLWLVARDTLHSAPPEDDHIPEDHTASWHHYSEGYGMPEV